jgi:hypothetical protein
MPPSFQTNKTIGGVPHTLASGAISRGGGRLAGVSAGDDAYNPGDLDEIDRRIRHLPGVVAYMKQKAEQCIAMTGSDNFEVVVQNDSDTRRPRAYCAPANNKGIHEELSEAVLLKAASNMAGK